MQFSFLQRYQHAVHVLSFCFATLLLSACIAQPAAESGQGAMQVTLLPADAGAAGDPLTVQLADSSGQPITDATVSLEGNMNHAGMAPVLTDGVNDEADGASDGAYQVPFQFTMMGDWIVTVRVERADGSQTTRDIELTVTDDSVQVKN